MEIVELVKLLEPSDKQFTGHLVLRENELAWTLSFLEGQLLYASDCLHPIRRWNRNLDQHFPRYNWQFRSIDSQDSLTWQISLLDEGIRQQSLSLIRAKLLVRSIIKECLVELSHCSHLDCEWQPASLPISKASRSVALSSWEVKMTFGKVKVIQKQWKDARLENLQPTLSPVLRTPSEAYSLPIERQYLTGDYTLWDIAGQIDKSPILIAESMLPLVENNLLELKGISDLPLTSAKAFCATSSRHNPNAIAAQPALLGAEFKAEPGLDTQNTLSTKKKPVIACIDDSPVLAHSLKKILASAGYGVLIIQEPMRGFSQLIEHRPALILLDLMLPNADGYSICKFLRDTPVFKQTPIIILTGKSKPIDRAKASLAGATEFLVKPPDPDQLLKMIHDLLSVATP